MTEWGPEIAVDGKRPEWLADDDVYQVTFTSGAGGWAYPEISGQVSVWPACIKPTHIRLLAYHWASLVIEKGFTPWAGGDDAPGDWDGGEVLSRCGYILGSADRWRWADDLGDIIGYRKKGDAVNVNATNLDATVSGEFIFSNARPNTPSPEWWIAQGRALQAEGKLPAGVVLPEPEIDYERYRAALAAFYASHRAGEPRNTFSLTDRHNILALIAAMPFMPKD